MSVCVYIHIHKVRKFTSNVNNGYSWDHGIFLLIHPSIHPSVQSELSTKSQQGRCYIHKAKALIKVKACYKHGHGSRAMHQSPPPPPANETETWPSPNRGRKWSERQPTLSIYCQVPAYSPGLCRGADTHFLWRGFDSRGKEETSQHVEGSSQQPDRSSQYFQRRERRKRAKIIHTPDNHSLNDWYLAKCNSWCQFFRSYMTLVFI